MSSNYCVKLTQNILVLSMMTPNPINFTSLQFSLSVNSLVIFLFSKYPFNFGYAGNCCVNQDEFGFAQVGQNFNIDLTNYQGYYMLILIYPEGNNFANVGACQIVPNLTMTFQNTTISPVQNITVNNGVSIINTVNTIYYVSSQSFTAPYIIDQAGILGVWADDGPWFDLESTTSSSGTGYLWATRGPNVANDGLYTDNNGSYSAFAAASRSSGSSNFTIYTLEDVGGSSGTINTYVNYSLWLSGSSTTFPHSGHFSPFRYGNNNPPPSVIYWVRVRAYPPNGTMPSNSQPQKTIILVQ